MTSRVPFVRSHPALLGKGAARAAAQAAHPFVGGAHWVEPKKARKPEGWRETRPGYQRPRRESESPLLLTFLMSKCRTPGSGSGADRVPEWLARLMRARAQLRQFGTAQAEASTLGASEVV